MPIATKSIEHTLTRVILLPSVAVLLLTTFAFSAYDLFTFRQANIEHLRTLSVAIASTSTAALAFDNTDDAAGALSSLKTDPQVVSAALYDKQGKVFATYPRTWSAKQFPAEPQRPGYAFAGYELVG